jgi:type I restriction enzyme, S subunit
VFVADGYAVYEQSHAIYEQFEEIRYFVEDDKFREMQRFEIHSNDLIMSCSGTMGKVAIVPEGIRRGIINQALLKLSPMFTALLTR